ncbi:hypothetical protein, unknown function [Leishmania mexicana MHOM/GT/2001/U1103]|uniref:Uncharacterized protein n=1 Tax=Leishmania mexicana (strain MHOM/GT/2001/U1103) TaxID=929439 RepID=E9AMJ5_LEIMU|nr:hypothetical protein, unknown function [Leishmania mexicana MHOM/GT/2001/U1103]CBZ24150.1 hypothetical protein, unknown function [Leishmania mexicana MHOM/GT/2001/U1103]
MLAHVRCTCLCVRQFPSLEATPTFSPRDSLPPPRVPIWFRTDTTDGRAKDATIHDLQSLPSTSSLTALPLCRSRERSETESSSTAQQLRETFLPLSLCLRRCRWRVCACACDMPLPLTSLAGAIASPCAVAGSTTTGTAVATGSSSGTDCYVIVWVEARERPVYACTAPLPSSGPSASSASAASAGVAAVPAVNVVTLRRFFAALVLLSSPRATARARAGGPCASLSCAATFTRETTPVLHATLPLGLVGAFGASPPYYYVAVLAPGTAAAVGSQLLAWLASSVLAALHPDSWATAGLPTGRARGTALLSLAADAPDLCSQLALYGAAEVGRARAGAAAMEGYGVREVLADSAGSSSLAAVLQEFEPCRDSPVAVAISTLLRRCWVPFTISPATTAASLHISLAGYFTLPLPSCLRASSSAASPLAPTLYACSADCREALRLLASFCSRRAPDPQQTSSADAAALAVLPLGGSSSGGGGAVALIAASVGCVHPDTVLYQAVLVHGERPSRGGAANCAAPYVHYLTTREVAACGTPWHPDALRSVWS